MEFISPVETVYKGHPVNSKAHLDFLVRHEISRTVGGIDAEMRLHRLALTGLYLYLKVDDSIPDEQRKREIERIKNAVIPKLMTIEKIVQEGNDLCKRMGWETHGS